MTCKNCNAPLAENERYCPQCGMPVPPQEASAITNVQQTPARNSHSEDGTVFMGGQPPAQDPRSEDGTVLMGGQQTPASEGKTIFFANPQAPGTMNLPPAAPKPAKPVKSPKPIKQKGQNYESSNIGLTIKGKIAIIIGVIVIAVLGVLLYLDFTSRKTSAELMTEAVSYAAEENYSSAAEQYRKIIASDPANTEAYLGYAELYLKQNDKAAAIEILKEGYRKTNSDALFKRCSELEDQIYGSSE